MTDTERIIADLKEELALTISANQVMRDNFYHIERQVKSFERNLSDLVKEKNLYQKHWNSVQEKLDKAEWESVRAVLSALAVTHGTPLSLGHIAHGIAYAFPYVGEESVLLRIRNISDKIKLAPASDEVVDFIYAIVVAFQKD